jgi:hypothetical protein
MVMTSFAHDYIERWAFMAVCLICIWLMTHMTFRDRIIRHLIPWVATIFVLLLGHLPRIPGIIIYDGPGVAPQAPVALTINPCNGRNEARSIFCPGGERAERHPRIYWTTENRLGTSD